MFWITDDSAVRPEQQQSHRGSEYRYPLFSGRNSFVYGMGCLGLTGTESERRLMSVELAESLGKRSPLRILADIDAVGERIGENQDGGRGKMKGPFGVFQARESAVQSSVHSFSSPDHSVSIDSELNDFGPCPDPEGLVEEIERQDWSTHLNDENLDLFVNSLDPALGFGADDEASPGQLLLQDASMANLFLHPGSGDDSLQMFSPGFISRTLGNGALPPENTEPESSTLPQMDVPATPSRGLIQGHGAGFSLPEFAEPLLRHYKQNIDHATTTIQAKRTSPWQIIFLPCALETFAELSLWNTASHTRSTIFYTLLAHSAFQLHMANKPGNLANQWREVGIRHQEKAQSHLRNALQLEMFGPKQAKYKELLMAILAMAMTSVCLPPPENFSNALT